MKKVNLIDIAEESWSSPKGKFGGATKHISISTLIHVCRASLRRPQGDGYRRRAITILL